LTVATAAGGFAAVHPVDRRYQSIAAGMLQDGASAQQPVRAVSRSADGEDSFLMIFRNFSAC